MKLDELLNKLLDIASKQTDPSAVEVQVASPDDTLNWDDLPLPVQEVTYRGPNNTLRSAGNVPRIELEV